MEEAPEDRPPQDTAGEAPPAGDGPPAHAPSEGNDEAQAAALDRVLILLTGLGALGLMIVDAILFTGILPVPPEIAAEFLIHFTSAALLLLTAGVVHHAVRRPVYPRARPRDPEAEKMRRDLIMEVLQALLVVLTGLAIVVEVGAAYQYLTGAGLPDAAVDLFRASYLFALAALTGALAASFHARAWSQGARDVGRAWIAPTIAALVAAGVGSVVATGVAGLPSRFAIFATNVGFIAIGVFWIWYARFPDPFTAFVRQVRELPRMRRSLRQRLLLVVVIAGGLGAFGLSAAFFTAGRFGVVDLSDPLMMVAAVGGVAITTVVVVVFAFLITGRLSGREETTVDVSELGQERRLNPEEIRFWGTVGGSAVGAAVLVGLGVVTLLGHLPWEPGFSNDLFVFGIIVGIGPYGMYAYLKRRRIEDIEDKFPELLRDLTEAQRAGMTLPQAIRSTAKGNYGVLTEELRKMSAEISWGVSFDDSFRRFAERVDTPLINRSVALILQASSAGGDVEEILTAASRDAREIRAIQRERKLSMSIYVMIVYIAFFVFLAVVAIMGATFIPAMAEAGGAAVGQDVSGVSIAQISPTQFNRLFFHAAVVQALGGGLVAGVMGEGYPEAGLKHSVILLIVAYVAFRFLIGI